MENRILTAKDVASITDGLKTYSANSGFYFKAPYFKDGYWKRELWYSPNSFKDELTITYHLLNGIVYQKGEGKRKQVATY